MVNQLVAQRPGISLDSWLSAVGEAGRGLPVELRRGLEDLKGRAGKPALLIRGFGVDTTLGPTPANWWDCRPLDPASETLRQEAAIALLGQSLGRFSATPVCKTGVWSIT